MTRTDRLVVIALDLSSVLELPSAFVLDTTYIDIIADFKLSEFNNIFYQEGLFLNMNSANEFYRLNQYWPDLVEYLNYFIKYEGNNKILNITLDTNQSPVLEGILYSLNIHKAILMPSYDNISSHIFEKFSIKR